MLPHIFLHFRVLGEPQGLAMVVDICEPNREAPRRHYVVPRAATKAISARDFATLQDKGCFLLPNEDTRCRLLQSFFHHVHPFMPIIDVRDFLTRYNTGGPKKVNLLLFWSILFAGVNVRLPCLCLCTPVKRAPFGSCCFRLFFPNRVCAL